MRIQIFGYWPPVTFDGWYALMFFGEFVALSILTAAGLICAIMGW